MTVRPSRADPAARQGTCSSPKRTAPASSRCPVASTVVDLASETDDNRASQRRRHTPPFTWRSTSPCTSTLMTRGAAVLLGEAKRQRPRTARCACYYAPGRGISKHPTRAAAQRSISRQTSWPARASAQVRSATLGASAHGRPRKRSRRRRYRSRRRGVAAVLTLGRGWQCTSSSAGPPWLIVSGISSRPRRRSPRSPGCLRGRPVAPSPSPPSLIDFAAQAPAPVEIESRLVPGERIDRDDLVILAAWFANRPGSVGRATVGSARLALTQPRGNALIATFSCGNR